MKASRRDVLQGLAVTGVAPGTQSAVAVPMNVRAIEVGLILAAQEHLLPTSFLDSERRVKALDALLANGEAQGRAIFDGADLLYALRRLRQHKVSGSDLLALEEPGWRSQLQRAFEIGRVLPQGLPEFADTQTRQMLELLPRHFTAGTELDAMIASIEHRLMEGATRYYNAIVQRCSTSNALSTVRQKIGEFVSGLENSYLGDSAGPQLTPDLADLIQRVNEAVCQACFQDWRRWREANPDTFQPSPEYLTGVRDTQVQVMATEFDVPGEEARWLITGANHGRAFRLAVGHGLLTAADVHYHLQACVQKWTGIVPRLGVDYVLRVASARQVDVLTCNAAIIERLLAYRRWIPVRNGAPQKCASLYRQEPSDGYMPPDPACQGSSGAGSIPAPGR